MEGEPIYEMLHPHDVLIISRNEEGLLVACNDGWGRVQLERVKYPEGEKKGEKGSQIIGGTEKLGDDHLGELKITIRGYTRNDIGL